MDDDRRSLRWLSLSFGDEVLGVAVGSDLRHTFPGPAFFLDDLLGCPP